jgi:hypothetical protein
MTCTLTSLLSSLYFADSQMLIGVMRTVALLPSEGGTQGFHHGALLVVLLRLLVAAHLEAAPRTLPRRGKISTLYKEMMRNCQTSMLAMSILVHGKGFEKPITIALRLPLTPGATSSSGPRVSRGCGMSTMTPEST